MQLLVFKYCIDQVHNQRQAQKLRLYWN